MNNYNFLANYIEANPVQFTILVSLLTIWGLVWKGIALWKAARLSQRNWFIALLIINTAGILEIIYIFAIARKKETPKSTPQPPSTPQQPSV